MTVLSLDDGGRTVDGTGHLALLPTTTTLPVHGSTAAAAADDGSRRGTSTVQAFTGGQGRGVSVSRFSLLLLGGIWGVGLGWVDVLLV